MGESTGTILRIEKISLHDGCGMRTVVFLKGCPLRCAWCSTPESQNCCPEVYYQAQRCTRCGNCIEACPTHALRMEESLGRVVRDAAACTSCKSCVDVCPSKARGIYGKEMTRSEVMQHIHRDEVFFYHSGGGVTLSGGDILLQAPFARDILMECRDSGIDTMAELDMYGDYENVALLLPHLDRFYVDIKLMDDRQHRRWTGHTNKGILENIRKAAAVCHKQALHVRVPLIPGVNDSRENIRQTAAFCRELESCAALEFLPYHRLGQATYTYLERDYAFASLPSLSQEDVAARVGFLKEGKLPFPVYISGEIFSKEEV